ncbi:uncharacterized protein [Periplaneta americana]|uniref:uncharacterized protein isoform X5 n=1 Tax=Periplaneta americana TaxID=6978 RepID=UPI0037E86170
MAQPEAIRFTHSVDIYLSSCVCIYFLGLQYYGRVVIDLIKMESEVDPLDLQLDNTYKLEENKSSSKEGNLSHLEVTGMKTECVDHSYEIKSEIKVEDTPIPTSFVFVRCEVDEDVFDLGRVKQEQKVEVSSEEDEVFPDRIGATNERTVSSEFDSIALEDNETVCAIAKNSGSSGRHTRTQEDEKQFKFKLSEICFSNSAKLNRHLHKEL